MAVFQKQFATQADIASPAGNRRGLAWTTREGDLILGEFLITRAAAVAKLSAYVNKLMDFT
jgi:hypothetical protein